MRASDEPFYNLKKLHVVFALSSLALLGVTVWMLLADHRREWKDYQRTYQDRVEPWLAEAQRRQDGTPAQETPARRVLDLPLVDALSRPVSIRQTWLPDLTLDYHFCRVARFDRCTTCHLGMERSEPACQGLQTLQLELPQPAAATDEPRTLQDRLGLELASRGIFDSQAVTVGRVVPRTPAAQAGLWPGDVLAKIAGEPVTDRAQAERLLEIANTPISLEVRRGLPHPYARHPRLDLFVGTDSPHPLPQFGCTVCHEGQGSGTAFAWASHTPNDAAQRQRWQTQHGWFWNRDWEQPMQAKRFVESSCLRCHPAVSDLEASPRFLDPPAPKLLEGYHLVRRLGCFACHEIKGVTESGQRIGPDLRLKPNYHEAAAQLLAVAALDDRQRQSAQQVIATPEDANARHQLVSSLQAAELPADTRRLLALLATDEVAPGTERKVGPTLRDVGGRLPPEIIERWIAAPSEFRPTSRMPRFFAMHAHLEGRSLADAQRLEPVELRAVAAYLQAASQPVPLADTPPEVTETPSAERGKRLFIVQGCAACHPHADVPDSASLQGPDLSTLGAKYTTEAGRRWLVSWIRNPARHASRTRMPNTLLEPVRLDAAKAGTEQSRWSDPAADLAAYLLGRNALPGSPDSSAIGVPQAQEAPVPSEDLNELALLHLSKTYPPQLAQEYLTQGIPEAMADQLPGDVRELLGPPSLDKKLRYVGRRTIRRRGCFGCHDIPGFEDAQAVGPALSAWGRKQPSLLGFGQVHEFVKQDVKQKTAEETADRQFYVEALQGQRREGFLWQKLRDPRSFDYRAIDTKTFNEQLLMGRFTLSDAEREAIATFVLGLVAEPPTASYVARPSPRQQAIVEGRKVLDRYGCAECHTLGLERWRVAYDPQTFAPPAATAEFDFLRPSVPAASLAASAQTNRSGLGHAELVGMPRVDAKGNLLADEDDDGRPLHFFTLGEPAAIAGQLWPVGGADVPVPAARIQRRWAPWGGTFARRLFPIVLAEARAAGSSAAELEAWGWVPPALAHEGAAVQPAWLYDYLLRPEPIRPAVALRMPQFRLSPEEARKLVNYFAAVSAVESPYTSTTREETAQGLSGNPQDPQRQEQAMRLLTDRTTYCAKCHQIGDFTPAGEARSVLAPNLDRVGRRLRADYLRRWLANPKSVLPYTAMPVNFPPEGPPMGQDLLPGTSQEQLDAVEALLLNYEAYLKRRVSIRKVMEGK